MTLGNTIAQYRKNRNLTQDALAQQLGVTNQAVSKWESDQCCPDVLLLPKLADIFGITLDALFGRAVPAKEEVNITQQDWPDDNVLRVVMYVGQRLVGYGPAKEGYEYHYHGAVNGVVSYASISCGDVAGNVEVSGNLTCGDVAGNVEVSGNLTCGNVAGNVDAGCNVTCGDVEGSVDAGCTVECGEVGGDIDAAGPVTIRK
jgi:transcriptional regulator with XRE-family HTH domain